MPQTQHKCPACRAETLQARRLFMAEMLGAACAVLECGRCGLVFKELFPTAEEINAIYADGYEHFNAGGTSAGEINSGRQKLARCRNLLKSKGNAPPRLLDIGCGAGAFTQIANDAGFDADGIDPYLPENAQSERLKQRGPEEVAPESYDVATLLNIAEHLDKPRETFTAVYRLLKPGGVMLLTCPFGASWAFQRYRAAWCHLALDEHLLFWTPRSLTYLLRDIGFKGAYRYRIAGSPFPCGRNPAAPPLVETAPAQTADAPPPPPRASWQRTVFQCGQKIQRQAVFANVVRSAVHWARLGDYLEYAICKN